MILYLDASALVKRYVAETGSIDVNTWITNSDSVVTSIVSRTEVVAAISRANRMKILNEEDAQKAISLFRSEWEFLQRLPITEATVSRGDSLAGELGLRGYDAIHLASAILWQEALDMPITLVSFGRQLWDAAKAVNFEVLPNPN